MDAGIGTLERVVGREHRLGVGAGEVDRAGVSRGGVAVGVEGGDRQVVGRSRRRRVGKATNRQGGGGVGFTVTVPEVPETDPWVAVT